MDYNTDQQIVNDQTTSLPLMRKDAWDTRITGIGEGHIDWADENLYRDLLKDFIEMREDCDIDC